MEQFHALRSRFACCLAAPVLVLALAGCGGKEPPDRADNSDAGQSAQATPDDHKSDDENLAGGSGTRKPIFGNEPDDPFQRASHSIDGSADATSVRDALRPLQVLVGKWRGITRKSVAGAKGIEEPAWRWDFSDPKQPALAFESNSSPFLKNGKLTWLPKEREFRLVAETKNGVTKTYRGKYTKPIEDVPGDGKVLERTYTLKFTQIEPSPGGREPNYEIEFDQHANNRYLMIVRNKAGDSVREEDRVANQREGTSFAAKLDDYGDKTCVVSQGLGTTTVSHDGKTYYVCCSGCKKAFEAEPEKWIASFEDWKRQNGK